MSGKRKPKSFPEHASDADAEAFVATANLSEYDFSGFKPMRFELKAKTANVSMRMPEDLLLAVKARAQKDGVPYQRFIRQTLERALAQPRRR